MTIAEMIVRVSRALEDSVNIRFSQDEIRQALQDGWTDLAEYVDWNHAIGSLTLAPDTEHYSVSSVTNLITPKAVFDDDEDRLLTPTTVIELDLSYPQWEKVQGRPTHWFMRGSQYLGFWPIPSESVNVKIWGAFAPSFPADSEAPTFAANFHQVLVEYAMYDLLAMEGFISEALERWRKYETLRRRFKMTVVANQSPPWRFSDATRAIGN